ncbi:MAG: hypothetical protein R2911_07955 [Caldilineaceae bacterium]
MATETETAQKGQMIYLRLIVFVAIRIGLGRGNFRGFILAACVRIVKTLYWHMLLKQYSVD